MMADGTWGDHVILHGAANCFQTCIHVISSLPHRYDVMICPEYDVTSSNRLVLGHVHELHYVSLIPQKGGKDDDNTAIQELQTRVMKWKTFDLYCGTLFANMFEEIRGLFFHMHSF